MDPPSTRKKREASLKKRDKYSCYSAKAVRIKNSMCISQPDGQQDEQSKTCVRNRK